MEGITDDPRNDGSRPNEKLKEIFKDVASYGLGCSPSLSNSLEYWQKLRGPRLELYLPSLI